MQTRNTAKYYSEIKEATYKQCHVDMSSRDTFSLNLCNDQGRQIVGARGFAGGPSL